MRLWGHAIVKSFGTKQKVKVTKFLKASSAYFTLAAVNVYIVTGNRYLFNRDKLDNIFEFSR